MTRTMGEAAGYGSVQKICNVIRLYPLALIIFWLPNLLHSFIYDIGAQKKGNLYNIGLGNILFCFGSCYGISMSVIFFAKSPEARHRWYNLLFRCRKRLLPYTSKTTIASSIISEGPRGSSIQERLIQNIAGTTNVNDDNEEILVVEDFGISSQYFGRSSSDSSISNTSNTSGDIGTHRKIIRNLPKLPEATELYHASSNDSFATAADEFHGETEKDLFNRTSFQIMTAKRREEEEE